MCLEDKLKDCKALKLRDTDGDYLLVCMNREVKCNFRYDLHNSHSGQYMTSYCCSIEKHKNTEG